MLSIAVFVSGGGTNLQAIIDSIESGYLKNVCISLVVSSNDNAYALKRAEEHSIESVVIKKRDFKNTEQYESCLQEILIDKKIDLVVLAGFMTILSENFVNHFKNKIINIHPSLIPSFCGNGCYGIKVHENALKRGVKVTGATVHFVNEEADGGPIILQHTVQVFDDDTPSTLQKRVMEQAEWKILPEALALISENKLEITHNTVRRSRL